MVMSRDVSHSIRVVDQPVAIAVMILDVDTGLIRGLSVAEDLPDALSQAVARALSKPAGSLPPDTLSGFWRLSDWASSSRPNSVVNRD
jgi:hypothetical protein